MQHIYLEVIISSKIYGYTSKGEHSDLPVFVSLLTFLRGAVAEWSERLGYGAESRCKL